MEESTSTSSTDTWSRSGRGAGSRHSRDGLGARPPPLRRVTDTLSPPQPSLRKFISLWVFYGSFFLLHQYLSGWITFLCIIAKLISLIYDCLPLAVCWRVPGAALEEGPRGGLAGSMGRRESLSGQGSLRPTCRLLSLRALVPGAFL